MKWCRFLQISRKIIKIRDIFVIFNLCRRLMLM